MSRRPGVRGAMVKKTKQTASVQSESPGGTEGRGGGRRETLICRFLHSNFPPGAWQPGGKKERVNIGGGGGLGLGLGLGRLGLGFCGICLVALPSSSPTFFDACFALPAHFVIPSHFLSLLTLL